jgi:flavin-dependent thymidylate synthase
MKVTLINAPAAPLATVVGSAKTCYSREPIVPSIMPDSAVGFITKLLGAGHLTTYQHSYFVFLIEGVSREALREFCHNHPHYNSEQQSQRYAPAQNSVIAADLGDSQPDYFSLAESAYQAYNKLINRLKPVIATKYKTLHKSQDQVTMEKAVTKLAMENARYVLPVGTTTHSYHTVNLMTLIRYKLTDTADIARREIRLIIDAMWNEVAAREPRINKVISILKDIQCKEKARCDSRIKEIFRFRSERASVPKLAQTAKLRGTSLCSFKGLDKAVADQVRQLYPDMASQDDSSLIDYLMRACNIADTQIVSDIRPALNSVEFEFDIVNSLACDMQLQRHRASTLLRPALYSSAALNGGYYVPPVIEISDQETQDLYRRTIEDLIAKSVSLMDTDPSLIEAGYLLPNATYIKVKTKDSYASLVHKLSKRTCRNAQDEAFQLAVNMAIEVNKVAPILGQYLKPPCASNYRNNIRPFCTESTFCGISEIWSAPIEEYPEYV